MIGINKKINLICRKMDTAGKILLTVFFIAILFMIMNYCIFIYPFQRSLSDWEIEEQSDRCSQVVSVLGASVDYISGVARDWAVWDDTYDFVQGKYDQYEEENYTVSPLATYGLSFMIMADKSGNIVSRLLDSEIQSGENSINFGPIAKSLLLKYQTNPGYEQDETVGMNSMSGYIYHRDKLYYISSSPILHSDGTGPEAGILIMGREITPEYLVQLASSHHPETVAINIMPLDTLQLEEPFAGTLHTDGVAVNIKTGGNYGRAYLVAADIYGEKNIVFCVTSAMDDYFGESTKLLHFYGAGGILVVAGFGLLWMVIKRIIGSGAGEKNK